MKKDIVICCETMLSNLTRQSIVYDGKLVIDGVDSRFDSAFKFCPWCGAKFEE